MNEDVECKNESHHEHRIRHSQAWGAAFAKAATDRSPSNGMRAELDKIMKKYPVLTAEEELEMIAREPVSWRELLVLHNARIVFEKAKKWSGLYRHMDTDDMIQYGFVGLWKAALKFDPARGLRFATYAGYWVDREMKEDARHAWIEVDARSDSLNRKLEVDGDEGGEVLDLIQPHIDPESKDTSLEEWLELRSEIDLVREIISRLPVSNERHRACYIRLRQFGQEQKKEGDVARECGLSRQRVNVVVRQIDGIVRNEVRRLDRMPRIQTTNWDRLGLKSVVKNIRRQTQWSRYMAEWIAWERYKLGIKNAEPLVVKETHGPRLTSEGFTAKRLIVEGKAFVFSGGKWVPAPKEEDYGYAEEA